MQPDSDFACEPTYSTGDVSNADCSTSSDNGYPQSSSRAESTTSSQKSLDIRAQAVLRAETISRRSLKVRHKSTSSQRHAQTPAALDSRSTQTYAATCCRDTRAFSSGFECQFLLAGSPSASCLLRIASTARTRPSIFGWQQAYQHSAWQSLPLP